MTGIKRTFPELFLCTMGLLLFMNPILTADYEAAYYQGLEAYQEEEYEQARQHLREALEEKETPEALNLLARTEHQLDRSEVASDLLVRSLELEEDQEDVYAVLAQILIESGRTESALTWLSRAREQFGPRARVFELMARAHRLTDRPRLAARALRRAHQVAPERRSVRVRLIHQLMRAGKQEDALEHARALAAGSQSTPEDHLLVATAALSANRYQIAETQLEMARYLGMHRPDLYRSLADLHARQERYREASFLYRRYLSMETSPTPEDHSRAGTTFVQTREYEAARNHLQNAFSASPRHWRGLARLARTLYASRGYEQATEILQEAFETVEDHADLRLVAGELALQEGRFEDAVRHFRFPYRKGRREQKFLIDYAHALLESDSGRVRAVLIEGIALYPEEDRFRTLLSEMIGGE